MFSKSTLLSRHSQSRIRLQSMSIRIIKAVQ